MTRLSPITWMLLAVLTAAVAGLTHIATLLALPWHSPDDAFARVSALVAPDARALLPPPDDAAGRLPFRDPTMLTAVCRFDLAAKPFRVTTAPFADGFVTIGFHSRHGIAFYGLTIQASDASGFDLVLGTGQEGRDADEGGQASRQVTVASPEPEGFVTLSTPIGDGSERADAEERLRHFDCRSTPTPS